MILRDERQLLFDNAFAIKKNPRVPLFSNFWTWKLLDQNEYSLTEVLNNYELLEKYVSEFQERYQFDSHFDLCTRNPIQVIRALGVEGFHQIDEDRINVVDHYIMEEDEYPALRVAIMKRLLADVNLLLGEFRLFGSKFPASRAKTDFHFEHVIVLREKMLTLLEKYRSGKDEK